MAVPNWWGAEYSERAFTRFIRYPVPVVNERRVIHSVSRTGHWDNKYGNRDNLFA